MTHLCGLAQFLRNRTCRVQVNHLATALLTLRLLPNLSKAAKQHNSRSRIAVVSSEVHFIAQFNEKLLSHPEILKTLSDKEYCTPEVMASRYPDSKCGSCSSCTYILHLDDTVHPLVLNVFFTRALADRLPPSSFIVPACVNPGYCYSELRRNAPLSHKIRMRIMDITIGRTAEQGARQLLWTALGPDGKDGEHVKHLHGAYVSNAEVREPSDFVVSKEGYETQERVWVSGYYSHGIKLES
jgi:retinol dehydrogenase 12